MIPIQNAENASQQSAAKERLISTVAAAWGASAAQGALQRIKGSAGEGRTQAILDELAQSIVTEAKKCCPDDGGLTEVWCEAANEAACAQFEAFGSRDGTTGT